MLTNLWSDRFIFEMYLPDKFLFLPICEVIGSLEHPLSSLSLEGTITTDGESPRKTLKTISNTSLGPGGGSGGTVLLFLRSLDIAKPAILSSIGGNGSLKGGGGGSGGRIHFHWSDIPTGDVYHHIANVKGRVYVRFVTKKFHSFVLL